MKKSIVVIPEFDKFGGTRTYFFQLINFLKENSFNVIIALEKSKIDDEVMSFFTKNSCDYLIIPNRPPFFYKLPFSLFFDLYILFLIKLKFKPDGFYFSVGGINWISSFILDVPLIYIIHSYPTSYGRRTGWIIRLILNKQLCAKKVILTVSNFSREKIVKFYRISENKTQHVHVIHNFSSRKILPILNGPKKNKVILSLGHVIDYKNPFFYIEVGKKFGELYKEPPIFIWAGDGPLLNECRLNVSNYEHIKFLGHIPEPELLLGESYIYFQPSLIENHSIAVLEAMSSGLPCIVSKEGGTKESVIDGKTGFVLSELSVEEAVQKINLLLNDAILYDKFSKAGIERYRCEFSIDRWKDKMSLLIHDVFICL